MIFLSLLQLACPYLILQQFFINQLSFFKLVFKQTTLFKFIIYQFTRDNELCNYNDKNNKHNEVLGGKQFNWKVERNREHYKVVYQVLLASGNMFYGEDGKQWLSWV